MKTRGYTLIEVLSVLMLMTLLWGTVHFGFNYKQQTSARVTARHLVGLFQKARTTAILKQTQVRLIVLESPPAVRIDYKAIDNTWVSLQRPYSLPKGFSLTGSLDDTYTFSSTGFCLNPSSITLIHTHNNASINKFFISTTGSVTVRDA